MASRWRHMNTEQRERQNALRRERRKHDPVYRETDRKRSAEYTAMLRTEPATRSAYLARQREWARMKYASSEEQRRRNAEYGLIRRFGMTLKDRDEMLARQGGVCAMCRSDNPRSKRAWHVDHDHATGRVRGILCSPCNTRLGHYERLRDEVGHGTIARYIAEDRPTPTAHSEAV